MNIGWIKKGNQKQIDYISNYLKRKRIIIEQRGVQATYSSIITYISSLPDCIETASHLNKIQAAWKAQKRRERNKGKKKEIGIEISSKANKQLTKLAKKAKTGKNKVVEELITKHYDQDKNRRIFRQQLNQESVLMKRSRKRKEKHTEEELKQAREELRKIKKEIRAAEKRLKKHKSLLKRLSSLFDRTVEKIIRSRKKLDQQKKTTSIEHEILITELKLKKEEILNEAEQEEHTPDKTAAPTEAGENAIKDPNTVTPSSLPTPAS